MVICQKKTIIYYIKFCYTFYIELNIKKSFFKSSAICVDIILHYDFG